MLLGSPAAMRREPSLEPAEYSQAECDLFEGMRALAMAAADAERALRDGNMEAFRREVALARDLAADLLDETEGADDEADRG